MIADLPKAFEENLFHKRYTELENNIKEAQREGLGLKERLLIDTSIIKLDIYKAMQKNKSEESQKEYAPIIQNMRQTYSKTQVNPNILSIHMVALESFVLESSIDSQSSKTRDEQEKIFLQHLINLQTISKLIQHNSIKSLLSNSLYMLVTTLQLYTKKFIIDKKYQLVSELDILFNLVRQCANKYPFTVGLCQKLFMIYIHMKIHSFIIHEHNDYSYQLNWYIKNTCNKLKNKENLLNYDTIVVLLYNTIKVLLGLDEIPPSTQEHLQQLYKIFQLKDPQSRYYNHILQLFFIIKIIIFRNGINEDNEKNQLQVSNDRREKSQLDEKLSTFMNINLDQAVVELAEITRNIVRHKVASLSTLIGLKLGIDRFSKDFLQIMHDSPFNNDIQTIKLCFELFQFRQFEKLEYLLETVLSVPATKNLKQREALVAMCAIFTGLYLQNRQEGLLYTKLNHEYHLTCMKEGKERKEILKQQTLLQHVGFGYYNLAKNEPYFQKRTIFLMKALQSFKKSHELNSENYLLNYCMGKIYLQIHDYNNAYKHSIEACKSHRGSWAPFCLLACVYMCQRKILKSLKLIEELMKKYTDVAILYYVRAYIEVNKILLEVETDEEIESAKMLGEEYYLAHYEKVLKNKSKSISEVLSFCRAYYQLSMEEENRQDEAFFNQIPNFLHDIEKGKNYIFPIMKLLLELDQIPIIQGLLKIIPSNCVEGLYYKALIHEKRKEFSFAIGQLKNGLEIDPFHPDILIKLSMLETKNNEHLDQAFYYLQLAEKFVKNNDYALAKGILLSQMGKIPQANELLLEDLDTAWCQHLPDLLYYY